MDISADSMSKILTLNSVNIHHIIVLALTSVTTNDFTCYEIIIVETKYNPKDYVGATDPPEVSHDSSLIPQCLSVLVSLCHVQPLCDDLHSKCVFCLPKFPHEDIRRAALGALGQFCRAQHKVWTENPSEANHQGNAGSSWRLSGELEISN